MDDTIMNQLNQDLEQSIRETESLIDQIPVAEMVDELKDKAEVLIRQYPIQSVLIGAGVGFLLGALLSSD
jgi:ElaB/YqjD/DUF883 family membrane-anchored ribosome-binding protein